jgi:hypothetical protein
MTRPKLLTDSKSKTDPQPLNASMELIKLQAYYLAGGQCAKCDRLLMFSSYGLQDVAEGWRVGRRVPTSQGGRDHAGNRIAVCFRCPVD